MFTRCIIFTLFIAKRSHDLNCCYWFKILWQILSFKHRISCMELLKYCIILFMFNLLSISCVESGAGFVFEPEQTLTLSLVWERLAKVKKEFLFSMKNSFFPSQKVHNYNCCCCCCWGHTFTIKILIRHLSLSLDYKTCNLICDLWPSLPYHRNYSHYWCFVQVFCKKNR